MKNMKTMILLVAFIFATLFATAQLVPDQQFLAPVRMKSTTAPITRFIPAHTQIYVGTTIYVTSVDARGGTLGAMITTGTAVLTASSVANPGFFLDTLNAQTAHGAKGFFGAVHAYSTLGVTGATTATTINGTTSITSPSVTASTTLTLPGTANTVVKTTGNANSVTLSNSLAVGDTLVPVVLSVTGNGSVGGTFYGTGAATFTSTVSIGGALTASVLPTFTIAAGQLIPTVVADTIGVNIAGLTTNAIVLVSYGEAVPTADTLACVHTIITGRLTVMGENGKKINYWVAKK